MQQLRLQEAKRAAQEAQHRAQSLLAKADEAQKRADREQERARSLRVDASQAQAEVGRAGQGLGAIQSLSQMSSKLGEVYTQVAQAQRSTQPQASTPAPQPQQGVVNGQGQVTGTIINTTA